MASIIEQYAITAAAKSARIAEAQRHAELGPALREDLTSYRGPSIAFGLVLAGGAYPLVLAVIGLVVVMAMFVRELIAGPVSSALMQLAVIPLFIALYAGFGAVIGSIWTALVSLITLPLVYLFVRSLKLKGSIIWLGAISGGLAGFIAVLPATLSLPWIVPAIEGWQIALLLVFGPGLATIVGQLGGAWGGRRAARYVATTEWKATLAAASDGQPPVEHAGVGPADSPADESRLQFRIHHMLWIFVWFSLLLSVIRLSGIPFEFALPLLVGWLVYQAATLYCGSLYFKWREARLSRSVQPFHVEPLAN